MRQTRQKKKDRQGYEELLRLASNYRDTSENNEVSLDSYILFTQKFG